MKYFTHQYNGTIFSFYIFGDRLFTNLFILFDKSLFISGSPLINYEFYSDIRTYIDRLSKFQFPTQQGSYLLSQSQINCINNLINKINEKWAENNKEYPDERSGFILDVPRKQFLPLVASHSLNKELVEYFYSLNNDEINRGLIFNPLLSTEQVISLINQNRDFGNYLIIDTSYKFSPELLRFLVSLDGSEGENNSKHTFSNNIISYRNNLTEMDLNIILPTLSDYSIFKVISYQNLPQYVTEALMFSLILYKAHLETVLSLVNKYRYQMPIFTRISNVLIDERSVKQTFDKFGLLGNNLI